MSALVLALLAWSATTDDAPAPIEPEASAAPSSAEASAAPSSAEPSSAEASAAPVAAAPPRVVRIAVRDVEGVDVDERDLGRGVRDVERLGRMEEQLRPGVLEDVRHLVARQPRGDRRVAQAGALGRPRELQQPRVVLEQQGHRVAVPGALLAELPGAEVVEGLGRPVTP